MPPWPLRRLILAPLMVSLGVGLIVLSPVLGLLTLLLRLCGLVKPGRVRWLRLLWLALFWFGGETAALVSCLGLWIASGFGGRSGRMDAEPYRSRHYALMGWFLGLVYGAAERTCGLSVSADGPTDCDPERPLIVLSRHAGPGDSLLVVHQLLNVHHRRPQVIMKASLQLDPGLDVVANRLPNVFIGQRAGSGAFTEQIARLATGLDSGDALVLFPEGGNWSTGRWRRAIRRLNRSGETDLAKRATAMTHLLAPRPGGVLAAIAACPTADVVFVAHTGLDQFSGVADLCWRLPAGVAVRARWWRVPSAELPRDASRAAQVDWLFGWWETMDSWIDGL
jgi:1-acyl-sn-glycerol-3-phosphate acyltransferase